MRRRGGAGVQGPHRAGAARKSSRICADHAKVLWSPSYFAASVGYVSESTVRRYIEHQWDAVGVMRRAYVFRLRPTARQHIALAACVESHRELYNAALQERRDAWAHSKTRINYGDQSAQLTDIRSARPDQAVWSFSSQQATLRRLNKAFAAFFRRVKAGQTAGLSPVQGRGPVRQCGVAQGR